MPVDANDVTRMRTRPQAADFYLAVLNPVTVWSGQVDGNHDRGATSFLFKNETELSAPEEHFTLWVGTAENTFDVGVLRFREKAGATMIVGSNDIAWTDNQYLAIKREVRPWAVLPDLENKKEDSRKVYVDENTNLHPLGRIGPPACAILDGGTVTVNFWSDSISIADDGLASHAWAFEDGSPATSAIAGTADIPIEVTYTTPGQKWVKYTVTDNNGKTHVRYSTVYVFNTTSDIAMSGFKVDSLVGDLESGVWRASITITQDCDVAELPEMAQVVIFNKAYWNGAQVDVGYGWKHRENISFVGYIVKDSVRKDAETGNTTFEVTSTVSIMKNLTCWGASLKSTGSAGWHTIPDMTLNLAAFHVFTEHTTLDHIADIYLDLDDITMAYIDIAEGPPYDHIKTAIGEAGRAILANNKFGQIYLEPNSQVSKEVARPDDIMFDMEHGDWRDEISLGEERDIENTCQVDFIGFTYSGTDPLPYGSLAPGRQWSTGNVQKVTGVRVDDQDDANIYSGLFAGNLNNEFGNVVVPMAGFWPVFDIAPQRYVRITLVASDTNRGLEWTLVKHLPSQVVFNINNEGGYCLTDITFKQYAYGPPGITNPIPTAPPTPPPPPLPPGPPDPPSEPWEGPIKACIAWTQDQLGYTDDLLLHHYASVATAGTTGTDLYDTEADFITLGVAVGDAVEEMGTAPLNANVTTVASVVDANHLTLTADIGLVDTSDYHICGTQWVDIIPAAINGYIIQSLYVRTGDSTVGAWLLTNTRVYYTANILTPSPSWSVKITIEEVRTFIGLPTDNTWCEFRGMHGRIQDPGYLIVTFRHSNYTTVYCCVYTSDSGGNWSYGVSNVDLRNCSFWGLKVDENTGQVFRIGSSGNPAYVYASGDGGATFTKGTNAIAGWMDDWRADLYTPFSGSGLFETIGSTQLETSPGISSDGGNSWAALLAAGYVYVEGKAGLTGWVYNGGDLLTMWQANDDSHFCLLRSGDAGTSWIEIGDANEMFGAPIGVWGGTIAIAAETWLPDEDVLLWTGLQPVGVSGQACRIRFTEDNGGHWYNKMGNWNTVMGVWNGAYGTSGATGGVGCVPLPRVGANA